MDDSLLEYDIVTNHKMLRLYDEGMNEDRKWI